MTHPLDTADPLAPCRDLFVADPDVVAYLDGNSLGRPLRASMERVSAFLAEQWGGRLIRGWEEGWLGLAEGIGDDLGSAALGAAAGQVIVADSTTVLLYKLARAAVALRPGRTRIVVDAADFPTDRFVLAGIADECGLDLVQVASPGDAGLTAELLADTVDDRTALVVASQVSYRSGWLLDLPAVTEVVHASGALMLADCSHSGGSVPAGLDAAGVDLATGCSYKYLNGGPGAPAWAYVPTRLQREIRQPIQGWLGDARPFDMGERFEPAPGIRRLVSGTPPVVGMLAMQDMIALIAQVGIEAVRAKSLALTEHAIALHDELLAPLGATLASPRDPARRGSHVTVDHPGARVAVDRLQRRGVIPDFRGPDGVRIGLSPLSTSFAELETGMRAIAEELAA